MSPDLALVDTNVLVYSLYLDSPQHEAAQTLLAKSLELDAGLCVAPQNLFELFAVVTNVRRVTLAFSPVEAIGLIETLLERPGIVLLPVPPDIVPRCLELLRGGRASGRQVFDALLTATMLGNGIRRVYTFNSADFASFDDIEVLTPGLE
jgi:predicted nucleic acid-binding protein